MASKSKIAVRLGVAGLVVFGVGYFAGPANTANGAATAVQGSAWGLGVIGGAARYAPSGFQAGMEQAGTPSAGFAGAADEMGKRSAQDTLKLICEDTKPKPKACT